MNPADLSLGISPNLTTRPAPPQLTITPKNGRIPIPRVDLEPIYVQLKAALGDGWNDYKDAVANLVTGKWNQAELSFEMGRLLSAAPSVITTASGAPNGNVPLVSTLHLHNQLITAIYANTLRDPPPSEVAPWVVATDKPASAAKNAGASGANDQAEERLKKEVMAIHPRDRRRIKTLKEAGQKVSDGFAEMQDYKLELSVKPPDVSTTQSAAGVGRTNWDISIRRRYDQKLAEEQLEFPTHPEIMNRIEPICYEEGLTGGVAQGVAQALADIVEQATEVYLKEMVGEWYAHSRSNGERCITTNRYKKQLRKEEDEAERGGVQRSAAGLLPAELDVQATRQGLTTQDLDLSLQLSDSFMRQDRFLGQKVALNHYPDLDLFARQQQPKVNGVFKVPPVVNGALSRSHTEDAMALDEPEWAWRGASKADQDELMKVLDECMAVS